MKTPAKNPAPPKQLVHLVFGGELNDVKNVDFKDFSKLRCGRVFSKLRRGPQSVAWQGAGHH